MEQTEENVRFVIQRILSGARPVPRESRIRWIKEAARILEFTSILDAFLTDRFQTTDMTRLSPDELLEVNEYVEIAAQLDREIEEKGIYTSWPPL